MVSLLGVVALASQRSLRTTPVAEIVPSSRQASQPSTEQSLTTEARALREGRPIDINRATAEELRLLPGIGPMLASRIVEARARIGRFNQLSDIDAVAGIGEKTLRRIAPLVAFGSVPQSGNNQPTDKLNAK